MPKILTAHIEVDDGSDFIADIANLTPTSIFVKTSRALAFREIVTVTFFSVSIKGEVVFVSRADPKGLVIVYEPTPELRACVEARIPDVEVLGPSSRDEAEDTFRPDNDTFNRAKTEHTPRPTKKRATRRRVQQTLVDMPSIGAPSEDVPKLGANGLVRFGSRAQYRSQHETNISSGAIVVRAKPLPMGTVHKLKLSIPDAGEYELVAKVAFSTEDSVGFLIDGFDRHAGALMALARS
jgi:hypothetical protein